MKLLVASIFAVSALLSVKALAVPPSLYLCHSPMNVDAAWDVKVSYSSQEEGYMAQLQNPIIGTVVPKPRGAPISVQQKMISSPGALLFQGRDFNLSMNRLQKATTITFDGRKVEGIRGQIDGTLPDSGGTTASFRGVNVICEVITALNRGGGSGR